MGTRRHGIGIVGCGVIADPYAADLVTYPALELLGVTDVDPKRSEALANKYSCRVYATLDEMLQDPAIDIVVNLTIHHAHYAVTKQILEAGKHVHSEKPLAMNYHEAVALVTLARDKGVRLSASPFTLMGEAPQTAWKHIRSGALGTIRLAYAEVNWGRIESWHPLPQSFYDVGAFYDVGGYPLSILTGMFGPARRITAYGTVLYPDRVSKRGVSFHIDTPDFVVAAIELANGTLVRLTTNFYVTQKGKQAGIEFHGDEGSLYLDSWQLPNACVEFAAFNQPYMPVPLLRPAPATTRWGLAVAELAQAITENRVHRATGDQAAHIVEILEAGAKSMQTHQPMDICSDFPLPEPMEWAR